MLAAIFLLVSCDQPSSSSARGPRAQSQILADLQTKTSELKTAVDNEIEAAKAYVTSGGTIAWRLLRRIVVFGHKQTTGTPKEKWEHAVADVDAARQKVESLLTELTNAVGGEAKAKEHEVIQAVKEFTKAVQDVLNAKGDTTKLNTIDIQTAIDAVKDEVQKAKQTAAAQEVASSGKRFTITTDADGKKHLIISDLVTSIERRQFWNKELTSVAIERNIISIGTQAFQNNKLASVVIPDSVTSIGDSAFFDNPLVSLAIGKNVTSIKDEAFGNNKLTSVIIPPSVTSIGNQAFSHYTFDSYSQIKEVILSETLYNKIRNGYALPADLYFEYDASKPGKKGKKLKTAVENEIEAAKVYAQEKGGTIPQ